MVELPSTYIRKTSGRARLSWRAFVGKRKVLTLSGDLSMQVGRKIFSSVRPGCGQARPSWMAGSRGAFDGLEEFHLRD